MLYFIDGICNSIHRKQRPCDGDTSHTSRNRSATEAAPEARQLWRCNCDIAAEPQTGRDTAEISTFVWKHEVEEGTAKQIKLML